VTVVVVLIAAKDDSKVVVLLETGKWVRRGYLTENRKYANRVIKTGKPAPGDLVIPHGKRSL